MLECAFSLIYCLLLFWLRAGEAEWLRSCPACGYSNSCAFCLECNQNCDACSEVCYCAFHWADHPGRKENRAEKADESGRVYSFPVRASLYISLFLTNQSHRVVYPTVWPTHILLSSRCL